MTDSMDSPLAINGRYVGGPLDGLAFSVQTVPGTIGMSLVVVLSNRDHSEVHQHGYHLMSTGIENAMQYEGELVEGTVDDDG
jgi:hypothetical protein